MHVDLSKFQPGSYAVLDDVIPWSFAKAAAKAGNSDEEADNLNVRLFQTLITECVIRDRKGNLITKAPSEFTMEDIDQLDARIVAKIILSARELLTKVDDNTDPN